MLMNDVLDVLVKRFNTKSLPGSRNDGYKVGLAIEGGGMRGVVSAGMLTALAHLGLTNSFDAVYGSSAGSINGAYFTTNQAAYGTTIYYNNANTDDFLSLANVLRKKPIMCLDYLLYGVFQDTKILNWQALIESKISFNILASSFDRQKVVVFNNFTDKDLIFLALKAGASIPWVAGDPVEIQGEKFVDAAFF